MSDKGSAAYYYLSATIAILGTVSYHYFVKKVPSTISPVVSIIGIYITVLPIMLGIMVLFPEKGGLAAQFRQLNWVQFAIAVSILFMEMGFLLMYRSGWDLSVGNIVTGVFINFILVAIGVVLLREQLNLINIAGAVLCIAGVAMIGYRSSAPG